MEEKGRQDSSLQGLLPRGYELRPTQADFVEDAFETLKAHGVFIGSAPCGIGKSLASLLAVLPLLKNGRLIICFRTRSQLHIYLKELKALELGLTAVSLFSKKDMCPRDTKGAYFDFLDECRRLRRNSDIGEEPFCSHYLNVKQRRRDADRLALECARRLLSPTQSVKWMSKHGFCAYEALKNVLGTVDVFLGTYHYAFDPAIRETLLRNMKTDLSQVYLVVDEAHNLPAFSRELLSDQVSEVTVDNALRETEFFEHQDKTVVQEYLDILNEDIISEARSRLDRDGLKYLDPEEVNELFQRKRRVTGLEAAQIMLEYGDDVREERDRKGAERIFSYNHRVGAFLTNFFGKSQDKHLHLIRKDNRDRVILEVRGFDSRELTDPVVRGCAGAIQMSGFLSPPSVYRDLTLFDSEGVTIREYESPFPPENRLILSAEGVSSRYETRTQETLDTWTDYIDSILETNRGNVAVFSTSYVIMNRLLSQVRTDRRILREEPKTKGKAIIGNLRKSEQNALFGVMGGKLSEGVDYPDNTLKGVVIVGLPYATWDLYQRALIAYHDNQFPSKGRMYAYVTPAILRLIQACGRVHRSSADKGTITILDERVNHPGIRQQLPGYYQREMKTTGSPAECSAQIMGFWKRHS